MEQYQNLDQLINAKKNLLYEEKFNHVNKKLFE